MISMIAAIGKNNELGKDNNLIWHIPNDMKFFKNTTINHTVVMGYNTYKSLPSPLKDRHMIVISKRHNDNLVEVVKDPQDIIDRYLSSDIEIFIIGGSSLYKYFLKYAKNLYLTEIDDICTNADSFFPNFDKSLWDDTLIDSFQYNNIDCKIHKYTRK